MTTILSIIRVSILTSLSFLAMIGLLSTPLDSSDSWMFDVVFSKAIGLIAACLLWKLYKRWAKTDKWIKAYDNWCLESNRSMKSLRK